VSFFRSHCPSLFFLSFHLVQLMRIVDFFLRRCAILSHIGSATFETRIQMATLAVKNVLAGVFGEEMPAELDVRANA